VSDRLTTDIIADLREVGFTWTDEAADRLAELDGMFTPLVIQPGDTLIVRARHTISLAQADQLRRLLRERLPLLSDVLVLGGLDELAVFRPGEVPT
jgi:hypothetical protein